VIRAHREFIGEMSPFLEIGANVGHTSYLLCNEFDAEGFALDISADSLRHGRVLMEAWHLERAPVRLAGDAGASTLRDGSLRMVCAFPDAQPVHGCGERVSRSRARARARAVFSSSPRNR
jgi:hypothetical protein